MFPDDERLELYSGVDLSSSVASVKAELGRISGIRGVTHVFFTAYTGHGMGYEGILQSNVEILNIAIQAVEDLCPNLQFWTFQTGGKSYGFEFVDKIGVPETPIKESNPRIPEPYSSSIMYYAQYDVLERLSKGKSWSFAEVRPDGVCGFVPHNNAMNLAQALGLFLSFFASREGPGARVIYPGPQSAYTAPHTDVSQSLLARFHIYASLHPDLTAHQAFNIGDEPAGVTWAALWPRISTYFGLVGTGPINDNHQEAHNIDKYMQTHRAEWAGWEAKHDLKKGVIEGTNFTFLTIMLEMAVFGREYDLGKAQGIGFKETRDTVDGYLKTFELMKNAKIIP